VVGVGAVVSVCGVVGVCAVTVAVDLQTGLLMSGTDTTSEEERGGAEVHSSICNSLVMIGGGMFCMACKECSLTFVGEGEECSLSCECVIVIGDDVRLSLGGEIDVVG
jgi:hypothetical protein